MYYMSIFVIMRTLTETVNDTVTKLSKKRRKNKQKKKISQKKHTTPLSAIHFFSNFVDKNKESDNTIPNNKHKSMTKHLLQSIIACLCLAFMSSIQAQAKDFTFDFSESIPTAWKSSIEPNGFEIGNLDRGTQYIKDATLTLAGCKNVTKVSILCSANTTKNSIALSVAGTQWGKVTLNKENNVTQNFTGTGSGNIVLSITRVEKSVYIKKIVVTADECGGNAGGGEQGGDEDEDDEDWGDCTYEWEPTTKKSMSTVFTAMQYADYSSFVGEDYTGIMLENDDYYLEAEVLAKVDKQTGIVPGTYPINKSDEPGTAVASPGGDDEFDYPTYIQTNFEYDEDYDYWAYDPYYIVSGTLTVEKVAEGVKFTINAKTYNGSTFTATYTGEATDAMGGGTDEPEDPIIPSDPDDPEDGKYNFEYEPTTPTTLNIAFDKLYYEDYTEEIGADCTDLYFVSPEFTADVIVMTPVAEGTGIAPGTYQIKADYTPGTVIASPGGDDFSDYPSFIATNYFEEDGEMYYNTAFYLESGKLVVEKVDAGVKMTLTATTHFGSTINATYTGKVALWGEEDEPTEDTIQSTTTAKQTPTKQLKAGKIIIHRNGHEYNTSGLMLK